jgi:hypothetical protein
VDRCCMCKRNVESANHLLFHCDVAYAIWSVLFSHFRMSWVMSRCVIDLFDCLWSSGKPKIAAVWKMVLTCLF